MWTTLCEYADQLVKVFFVKGPENYNFLHFFRALKKKKIDFKVLFITQIFGSKNQNRLKNLKEWFNLLFLKDSYSIRGHYKIFRGIANWTLIF